MQLIYAKLYINIPFVCWHCPVSLNVSLFSQSFEEIEKKEQNFTHMQNYPCLGKRLLSECFPGKEKQMRNSTCFIYLFTLRIFLKGRFIRLLVNVSCQRLGNEFSYSGFISITSKSDFMQPLLLCKIIYTLIFLAVIFVYT